MFGSLDFIRNNYPRWLDEKSRANRCIACGEFESKCPQHLSIADLMIEVDAVLAKGQPYPKR